jgi:hypothetical protein
MPAGVRHLSDRDWHSTLQLLVFYAYIQIIVIIVAVIWDVSKDTVSFCPRQESSLGPSTW